MERGLDGIRAGQRLRVTGINAEESYIRRLAAFGLVPGTLVSCRYHSPRGDLTALEVRGAVLALRTGDLKGIRGEEA